MSEQSEIQAAEREIREALQHPDAMREMLAVYSARQEAGKLSFVAALIGRVVVSHAMRKAPPGGAR